MLQRTVSGAIVLLLMCVAAAKTIESRRMFSNERKSSLAMNRLGDLKDIKLSIRSLHRYSDRWEIELETRNLSQSPVFVLASPIQANGNAGPYVSLDENDDSVLDVSIRFYSGPTKYLLYSNATAVKLTRLDPQTSYVEKYGLPLPIRNTIPPYGEKPVQNQIDGRKIKAIKASVGVLSKDDGIVDLLRRKPFGPFSNGGEILAKGAFKGKALMDAQFIISASYSIEQ